MPKFNAPFRSFSRHGMGWDVVDYRGLQLEGLVRAGTERRYLTGYCSMQFEDR